MIAQYMAMQNAILAQNMTAARMMQSSDAMLSSISFGNSQPLRPSFAQADSFELQQKSDETKITALQKMMVALEQSIGKSIARSTPKFGGLDIKA